MFLKRLAVPVIIYLDSNEFFYILGTLPGGFIWQGRGRF
jgi:hypothetical protein